MASEALLVAAGADSEIEEDDARSARQEVDRQIEREQDRLAGIRRRLDALESRLTDQADNGLAATVLTAMNERITAAAEDIEARYERVFAEMQSVIRDAHAIQGAGYGRSVGTNGAAEPFRHLREVQLPEGLTTTPAPGTILGIIHGDKPLAGGEVPWEVAEHADVLRNLAALRDDLERRARMQAEALIERPAPILHGGRMQYAGMTTAEVQQANLAAWGLSPAPDVEPVEAMITEPASGPIQGMTQRRG